MSGRRFEPKKRPGWKRPVKPKKVKPVKPKPARHEQLPTPPRSVEPVRRRVKPIKKKDPATRFYRKVNGAVTGLRRGSNSAARYVAGR